MHAQREYAPARPFLTMQLFDVEQSAAAQGIEVGGYDLVIATNVLHATKNIRRTLANAKATLRQGGLLLLNELNRSALFVHLTFGLLEGWWRYEDTALRLPGCPGLAPDTWARVLTEEGFRNVFFPAEASHVMGQHILVAQSDGIIQQTQDTSQSPAGAMRPDSLRSMKSPTFESPLPSGEGQGEGSWEFPSEPRPSYHTLPGTRPDKCILWDNTAGGHHPTPLSGQLP